MGEDYELPLGDTYKSIQPFFDVTTEMVVILSEDGSIKFGNLAISQFLGLDQASLPDLDFKKWFPEWLEVKDDLLQNNSKTRIVHLKNPNINQHQSFRLSYFLQRDGQWLMLFSDPWTPLRNSKNISELILNYLDDPIIYIDQDYRIRAFNSIANLMIIQIAQEPIVLGTTLLEYVHNQEDWEIFEFHIKLGFSGKKTSFNLNNSPEYKNKITREFQVIPLRDVQEEILGVLIIGKNFSKDNRIKNLLKYQDDFFTKMFQSIHDPAVLWKKNADGTIIFEHFNVAAETMSNGKIEEKLGMDVRDFFKDRPEIAQRFYDCFETGINKRIETHFKLTTTNDEKWFLADYIKISDEYLLNITIDINEQKITELALQEKQRQLSTLFENLPGMAYRCKNDPDWIMEFVSAGGEELTGYPTEDLIENRKISYLKIIHPEDRQKVNDVVQKSLNQKDNFEITYRIITADHQEKWVWEKGEGIFNNDGELVVIEGFISDVTKHVNTEQAAEKAKMQAQALKQALEDLSSQLELSQVLRRILVSLKTVLDFDSATLFLKEQDRFKVVAARGFDNTSRLINKTFPATDLLLREIQTVNAPIILEDAQNDPRFKQWEGSEYVRGWMGVPLFRHDEFIGLMTIDNHKPAAYTQEDASLALSFANSAAIVIENARLFDQTQQMALTDTLTGVYNRRYFYELALKEFARSKRYQDPLSIIMIDIDHFKNVNDRYGHLAGDQVLMQFVQRIQNELRASDVLARFGGEEFIILLPETNLGDATQVAERLREVTSQYPFLLVTAQTFITISLGVSCFKFTTISLDQLIDESDKALYEAKQFGRNRVRSWQQK
jgi:diguanylate cyclase (GGDEF)-like protein/PAS domain S-box-containing protein